LTRDSVARAADRLAAGGTVLVAGDDLRGGDIDLAATAARFADAAAINFLALHATISSVRDE
jgi:3,4-dihydroxy-2-butanone 4-phosphate synthase